MDDTYKSFRIPRFYVEEQEGKLIGFATGIEHLPPLPDDRVPLGTPVLVAINTQQYGEIRAIYVNIEEEWVGVRPDLSDQPDIASYRKNPDLFVFKDGKLIQIA